MLVDAPRSIGPPTDPQRYLLLPTRLDTGGTTGTYMGHDALTGEAVVITVEPGDFATDVEPTPEGWVRTLDRFVGACPESADRCVLTVREHVDGPTIGEWIDRSDKLTFDETEAIVRRLSAALDARPHGCLSFGDVVLSGRGFLVRSDVDFPPGPDDDSWRRDADARFVRTLRAALQRGAIRGPRIRVPRSTHRAQRALVFSIVLGVIATLTAQAGAGEPDGSKIEVPVTTTTEPIGLIGEPGTYDVTNAP